MPGNESLAAVTRLLPQTRYEPAPDTADRPATAAVLARGGRIDIICPVPELAARTLEVAQLRALVEADAPPARSTTSRHRPAT